MCIFDFMCLHGAMDQWLLLKYKHGMLAIKVFNFFSVSLSIYFTSIVRRFVQCSMFIIEFSRAYDVVHLHVKRATQTHNVRRCSYKYTPMEKPGKAVNKY